MSRKAFYILIASFAPVFSFAQESVCDIFHDLQAFDGRELILTGDLIISKDVAVLGAADCDDQYETDFHIWPTALDLRSSVKAPPDQMQRLQEAAAEADRLRAAGRTVKATASFSGRVLVKPVNKLPAGFVFDSVESLNVKALPDSSTLPVIPICALFENLQQWKDQRIAVRGETVHTFEGTWLSGPCKGGFVTGDYRWPVSLSYGGPAYSSQRTESLTRPKIPAGPAKSEQALRGRYSAIRTETWVGRLRTRSEYVAVCSGNGGYFTNGFGHLNGAAAELVVEEIRDVELTHRTPDSAEDESEEPSCQPPDSESLCALAKSLDDAVSGGCLDRAREILSTDGIDSKDGGESEALRAAIGSGNEGIVKWLLDQGAPVNPSKFDLWPPLWEAARPGRISVMKLLLQAGADVDARDHDGGTLLATLGFFNLRVVRLLLDAKANPNAVDRTGETALMRASGYGYEDVIRLLIERGANVDLRDHAGRTALMHAAAGKYVDAIPLLLEKGADLYAQDDARKTALDIAKESKNEVAVELLTAAMNGGR